MRRPILSAVAIGAALALAAYVQARRLDRDGRSGAARLLLEKSVSGYRVESVAYLPEGRRLVAGAGRELVLIDARTGDSRSLPTNETALARTVASRFDGRRVAVGFEDGSVVLLDPDGGAPGLDWKAHRDFVAAVAFSPDGTRIASGSNDGSARVWDASDGRLLATLEGRGSTVWGVAFSPDGERVATASDDRTARIWGVSDGRLLATLEGTHVATSVAFSPDGRFLAVGRGDGAARVHDAASGRTLMTLVHRRASVVLGVAFDPKSPRLATAAMNLNRLDPPGEVRVWNLADGRAVFDFENFRERAHCVAFAPDGSAVAAGLGASVLVWDVRPASPVVDREP